MTDFLPIIKELEEEAEKFRQAAQIIRDLQSSNGAARDAVVTKPRKKPRFSAAARKKMSEAQRARWAKIKNISSAKPVTKAA